MQATNCINKHSQLTRKDVLHSTSDSVFPFSPFASHVTYLCVFLKPYTTYYIHHTINYMVHYTIHYTLHRTKHYTLHNAIHLPFTLLNSTQPPAATIRLVSSSLLGLWSKLSCCTVPSTHAIALESPTLA